MLQFLSQWLARDPARLAASLAEFVGHAAYGLDELRGDLKRFVFLLGGSDGEPLFGLPPPCTARLHRRSRGQRAVNARWQQGNAAPRR